MALVPGSHLGPYEVIAPLGAGGMGEVYRARDTRLGRDVAVKQSHELFSVRFEREARAIAQLNHPHICTLHNVGPDYLVMELVEGETLANLVKRGPFTISDVLKYGAQIAAALAAAHAKGIVHRDLKPANIMITKAGAKVFDGREGGCANRSLRVGSGAVRDGNGKATDARSAACYRPAPPQLARSIEHCLAPDPNERWQSARDVTAALELVALPTVEAAPARSRSWKPMAAAGVLVAVAAAAGAAAYFSRPATQPGAFRFTISPPDGTVFAPAFEAGVPALSPDGRSVAFVADGSRGRQLWVRSIDAFDARPLPGTEDAIGVFWSPDSRMVGFSARGTTRIVDLAGGQPQPIARQRERRSMES
ncbi:MAG: protein kinase domain-containing protein [Vicinamibacterales bacterium]